MDRFNGKLRLYGVRAIPVGSFASMLVNDMGRKFGPGIDLTNYEVKSARRGSSYEYQYHKFGGEKSLRRICRSDICSSTTLTI